MAIDLLVFYLNIMGVAYPSFILEVCRAFTTRSFQGPQTNRSIPNTETF